MSKLIRAIEITSGNMTTDATEATAAWSSGTTYAAAATVSSKWPLLHSAILRIDSAGFQPFL